MVDHVLFFGKDKFLFCLENPSLLAVVGISKKDKNERGGENYVTEHFSCYFSSEWKDGGHLG